MSHPIQTRFPCLQLFFLPPADCSCLLILEFLTEGTLHVERADAAELLDIKRGAWPLEKVKAEAERLFQLAQEAFVRSPLPPEPDRPRAERLCVHLMSERHKP